VRTRLCDTFGIEFPIFAFSHCRDVVAAVSKAGGLGVLGALAFPSPEALEVELRWIDEHVGGKPYGVDVVMPASEPTEGAPVDLVFQSIAGTEAANQSFGVNLALLDEACAAESGCGVKALL